MLRKKYVVLAACLITGCAVLDDGTKPRLFPLDIGKFERISIISSGIKSTAGKELGINCGNFILSQKNIEEYFKRAKRVYKNDYRHMLDWSPCHVRGEVLMSNGDIGSWSIHQYRGGTINIDNGETIYMYCPNCTAKKFDVPEHSSK